MGHCRKACKALYLRHSLVSQGQPINHRHRNPLPAKEAGFLFHQLRLRLRALRACGGRHARSPAAPLTRLARTSQIETAPASGLALRATFGRLDPCRPFGLMAGPEAPPSRQASRSPAAPATRLGFLRPSGLAVPAQPGLIGRSGQRPQSYRLRLARPSGLRRADKPHEESRGPRPRRPREFSNVDPC